MLVLFYILMFILEIFYTLFMENDPYLAAFTAFPKANTIFWKRVTSYFPDLETAWKAPSASLKEAQIPERAIVDFLDFRTKTNPEKEREKLLNLKVRLIPFTSDLYPENLKEIYNPPFVLFVKGELKDQDRNAIAVVGSRKMSDYGRRATAEITGEIAPKMTIISGLALGLDAVAHEAALKAGGRTIAVLANGLDRICPATNRNLAERILTSGGAIISEQPLGMPPLKQNFPARNRIISGLSLGVLITEAGEHSGTLHTANFALEQNKNVYAVPGPIYNPLSVGPNSLLKLGAKAVTCGQDVLEDFGLRGEEKEIFEPKNDDERLIFDILATEPKHIDTIIRESEMEPNEVSGLLSLMEIEGKIKHLGGMVYVRR